MRTLLVLVSILTIGVAQAQEPVHVITHIDLMPAGTATGVTLLKQFAAATLKEKECLRFEVLQQDGRPNHFTLVATWKDKSAFDAHDSAPYTKEFREKMQPLIGSPWDERLHQIIKP
ncbi:MAG TPA: putative quinol monooxygenase [Bryobacteraceae bacterium]|nr:putative quinol monooxygenase [Bryobacteraceae bacterium]